ncbi:hypothetical protein GALMADRAFT_244641 [Galerina marginata CBS 339.88]|uniref:Protein arginine methyltransferase NDUFAF7 n=1 Tax=Galerina marginata (strain CBS 339.88) TaxID=685588 RepID=A0A067T9F5_GALM3|nr:hypothetical protein GALMADRAFT_244641 [Galerina marginata CBS 339.88]
MSFATYMQLCLSHPMDGYYMNPANKVFGTDGDFITSPEISQTFGELIALWLLQEYKKSERDSPLRLVELGPGKGTLMGDILRVILKFEPRKNINIHLVETSPAMRDLQSTRLTAGERPNVRLHWHNSINEIPPSASEYTMLVAHEFFDALPTHILQRSVETGFWHEVLIASKAEDDKLQANNNSEETAFLSPSAPTPIPSSSLRRVLSAKPSNVGAVLGLSSPRFGEIGPGSFLEVSPMAFKIARKVGELLTAGQQAKDSPTIGGCGLIIDYGGDTAYGDSLRAFKNHEIVDIFREPGHCDITANVDFAFLKEAMQDIVTPLGPIPQGDFLTRMGLALRLRTLLQAAKTEEHQNTIHGAAMRLVDPKGMGRQYQVLGITNARPTHTDGHESWPFVKDAK